MKTTFAGSALLVCIISVAPLPPTGAEAARPANPSRAWQVIGNQTSGSLVIDQSAVPMARRVITGSIFGNAIGGSHCPTKGRIAFVRKNSAGAPFQIYERPESQDGVTGKIGGSFMIWNSAGGAITSDSPDLDFSAIK